MGTACREMTLRSALSDPLIRTVMAADKVDPHELETMLRQIADEIAPRRLLSEDDGGRWCWCDDRSGMN